MYSQVELCTVMIELSRVKQSEVEQWWSYVESRSVKESHGRIMKSQVE